MEYTIGCLFRLITDNMFAQQQTNGIQSCLQLSFSFLLASKGSEYTGVSLLLHHLFSENDSSSFMNAYCSLEIIGTFSLFTLFQMLGSVSKSVLRIKIKKYQLQSCRCYSSNEHLHEPRLYVFCSCQISIVLCDTENPIVIISGR